MGPLVVLLVLSENPQKGDVHDCYFTIFKPMEQKVIYFLNLKLVKIKIFDFCNQSIALYHNWLFNLPFSHLKC